MTPELIFVGVLALVGIVLHFIPRNAAPSTTAEKALAKAELIDDQVWTWIADHLKFHATQPPAPAPQPANVSHTVTVTTPPQPGNTVPMVQDAPGHWVEDPTYVAKQTAASNANNARSDAIDALTAYANGLAKWTLQNSNYLRGLTPADRNAWAAPLCTANPGTATIGSLPPTTVEVQTFLGSVALNAATSFGVTPATPHKIYIGAIILIVALGTTIGFALHERSIGAANERTKTVEATAKVERDTIQQRAQAAVEAEKQRQAALDRAKVQIARQRADSVRQDSLVKVSANARFQAEHDLADSAATVAQLRADLGRVISAGRADSAVFAQARAVGSRTIASLIAVIAADSLALSAEQQHSRALQALNQTLAQEITVLKKSRPSTFGNVVRGLAFAGGGVLVGRLIR